MIYPDFKLPIEDAHAAEFWWDEFVTRYQQTHDEAFKEAAERMSRYIDRNFDHEDEFDD